MSAPITNAADISLDNNTGTLPDMSSALLNWFQKMIYTQITKTVKNFVVVENSTSTPFMGVWQAFTPEQLMMKPEGERSWAWWTLHATVNIILNTDEIIRYRNKDFRVAFKIDHQAYGFVEYHLVEDYKTNSSLLLTETGNFITTEDGNRIEAPV